MNGFNRFFLLVIACLAVMNNGLCQIQKMVVTVPVANMRTGPGAAPAGVVGPALSLDSKTPNTTIEQDSQLLMNELVLVEIDENTPDGWYKIQAVMQPGLVNGTWQGCTGFIQADQVKPVDDLTCINTVIKMPWVELGATKISLGTCLSAQPSHDDFYSLVELANGQKGLIENSALNWINANLEQDIESLRTNIVQVLYSFEGSPYIWGGCSAYDKSNTTQLTGVDCSGLIYLAMRAHGLLIPRNSHAQYLKAGSVASGIDLQPGDLVYARRADRECMRHVLIFLGNEKFIETTGLGFSSATEPESPGRLTTQIVSSQEYFGCPVTDLYNDREFTGSLADKIVPCVLYLRTFFTSDQKVQQLRNDFCSAVNNTQSNL